MTGKKHSTAATIAFDSGLATPNQLLKIGAKARIGIVGRDGERHERLAGDDRAGGQYANEHAGRHAEDEPRHDLAERVRRRRPQRRQVRLPRLGDGDRAGQDELLDLEQDDDELPDDEEADEHAGGRQPGADARADARRDAPGRQLGQRDAHADSPSARTRAAAAASAAPPSPARSASRTLVTSSK
jgi:hypothetical protein